MFISTRAQYKEKGREEDIPRDTRGAAELFPNHTSGERHLSACGPGTVLRWLVVLGGGGQRSVLVLCKSKGSERHINGGIVSKFEVKRETRR